MSPILDEQATTSDPQVTADHRAAKLFAALARAIELDGMPRPANVNTYTGAAQFYGDDAGAASVDDWAELLGTSPTLDKHVHDAPYPWRKYFARGVLDGVEIVVWCAARQQVTS